MILSDCVHDSQSTLFFMFSLLPEDDSHADVVFVWRPFRSQITRGWKEGWGQVTGTEGDLRSINPKPPIPNSPGGTCSKPLWQTICMPNRHHSQFSTTVCLSTHCYPTYIHSQNLSIWSCELWNWIRFFCESSLNDQMVIFQSCLHGKRDRQSYLISSIYLSCQLKQSSLKTNVWVNYNQRTADFFNLKTCLIMF